MSPIPCHNESERLAALSAYGILNPEREEGLDHITSVVTRLFGVPIAAVTLVDAERQWFKSSKGLAMSGTPRRASFCAHAMQGRRVMVVPDAKQDPRFAENPLVLGEPHIRFYAGAPLRTPEGLPLGALCIIDHAPRQFKQNERRMLLEMAALVEDELLLRRVANELRTENFRIAPSPRAATPGKGTARRMFDPPKIKDIEEQAATGSEVQCNLPIFGKSNAPSGSNRLRDLVEQTDDAIFVYNLEGRFVEVNTPASELFGYEREELLRMEVTDLEVGFDPVKGAKRWREMGVRETAVMENLNRRKDGGIFWAEVRVSVAETEDGRFLLALVRDISERKQAERLLRMRAQQQRGLAALGQKALRGIDLKTLMGKAVAVVGEMLELEICRVLEHVPERGGFVTRAGLDVAEEELDEVAARDDGRHAAVHVLHTGEPLVIQDVRTDPRFVPTPWLAASGASSGLHVSIGGDGSHCPHYGVLAAYTRERRQFTDDDVYFVQSVANVLAAAITRQRSEDKLRKVEARYQRIAAHTPGVVYQYLLRTDGTLAIPFLSESCRELYELEREEIQARPELMMEAVHPEDRPDLQEASLRSKQQLIPLHWQGRLRRSSGEVRWVRVDSRPERLPDGGVICDGMVVDVTEEETRKEVLRQTEKRFRLAIMHAPFPIMLHAEGGEILQVNAAWTHLTGYPAGELKTMTEWLERAYTLPEKRAEVQRFMDSIWEHVGAADRPGCKIRCADGGTRIWNMSCANLERLPDGRWLHILSAVDVTGQWEQESALRQAKEEAERANAAKSVFLSRMSHELRTPLNAILGFGQLLEMGALDGDDRQSVDQILKGGKHLVSLVDEVLDLARVESGELDLKLTAITWPKMVDECVNFVARSAQAAGVNCRVEKRQAGRRAVLADEQRLRQVLLNLLSNAIKYNREGGGVRLSFEQRPGGRVRLKIADDGPGISPEGLARLFVPFERLGQEFGEVEGTGLGLVVSKQLIEAMDGSIGVESEAERGSTFWIELPVAAVEEPAARKPDESPASAGGSAAFSAVTVLYIEDNPSNVQVVKMVMERLRPQWRFLAATDGASGLQQAREQLPDVILLDLQLPKLNGDKVLAEIRAGSDTARTPVLLLSADAMMHSRERLLALGADGYLSKPFDVGELLLKIDELLAGGRK